MYRVFIINTISVVVPNSSDWAEIQQQGWEYRGEHPGSGAGPGVVQQHVFKNITTQKL